MEARTRRVTECRNGKALASSESVEDVVIASGTGSQDRFSEIRHPFTELTFYHDVDVDNDEFRCHSCQGIDYNH